MTTKTRDKFLIYIPKKSHETLMELSKETGFAMNDLLPALINYLNDDEVRRNTLIAMFKG